MTGGRSVFCPRFTNARAFSSYSTAGSVLKPPSNGSPIVQLRRESEIHAVGSALFLESDTYTSKLYLVNPLTFGVQINVTLYDMSGAQLTVKQLYILANTQQSVSIRQILSDAGIVAEAGSVELISPQTPAPMLGQLSITRSGTKAAYLDEELFMPDEKSSQILRSVIDSPENSPIVALTNASAVDTLTLRVNCIPSNGVQVSKTVVLQPKQTVLSRACSSSAANITSAASIDVGFSLAPESEAGMAGQGVAGISITTNGLPGELAAFGFVEHKDTFGDYFSAMNFYDPNVLQSSGMVFAGVPVGASRLLPSVAYTPQLAVTNFSSSPRSITATYATTSSGFSSSKQVANLSIPANSSRMVSLSGVSGDADWQNSFVVHPLGSARRPHLQDDV